ncbi:MAG: helix-turn-helix transcriptional regulator [Clostridia bacterium]|nr:helix-turn-helix transcriptional regulator [Clostridia bacterium]
MKDNVGLIGLRIVRKQRNLNQLKVAMDLNISREALSHYENGKRCPDVQMLRRLSDYFNVSIDFLINGKEFTKK